MADEVPKLNELLSHRPLGRILELDRIGAEFELIRRAFEADGKAVPGAKEFKRVGDGSGTHLLKLNSPRAPIGQHISRFIDTATNRHPELFPSIDAGYAKHCKIAFRPLEVAGHPTRSLADHILNPDEEVSPVVVQGFADAFGDDALLALCEALKTPLPVITSLPVAEFPIVFLPRPGGGDLQATPIAPAEAYVRFGEVTEPYFKKQGQGERVPRGRWGKQFVADKPQNISSAVGKQRTRFFAEMPAVLDRWSAELYRYAHGGMFPRWYDDRIVDEIDGYANLLDRSTEHSNAVIRKRLDDRAERLIRGAREFIDETLAEAKREYPNSELATRPSVATIILRRHWQKDGFDRARRALTSDHFKSQLEAAGER